MRSLADNFVALGGQREDVDRLADPKDVGELVEPLRSRIFTVIHDANGGLVLVSGHRSPWQQYMLRVERVGAARAFDRNYPGSPRTAIPYSSQHQKGLAADMGGTALYWLRDHAAEYGLKRTVASELWHYEAVGTPTRRIIPFGGPFADEEFTVDAEAKAAFTAIEEQNAAQLAWMMRMEARIEQLEKDRWKPTTSRVRKLADAAGIKA